MEAILFCLTLHAEVWEQVTFRFSSQIFKWRGATPTPKALELRNFLHIRAGPDDEIVDCMPETIMGWDFWGGGRTFCVGNKCELPCQVGADCGKLFKKMTTTSPPISRWWFLCNVSPLLLRTRREVHSPTTGIWAALMTSFHQQNAAEVIYGTVEPQL